MIRTGIEKKGKRKQQKRRENVVIRWRSASLTKAPNSNFKIQYCIFVEIWVCAHFDSGKSFQVQSLHFCKG